MTPRQLTPARIVLAIVSLLAAVASAPRAGAQPLDQSGRAEFKRTVVNQTALRPGDKAMLAVELEVKDGFHAQSRTPSQEYFIKFDLKLDASDAVTFGDVVYPAGKDEDYPGLGKLNVYTGTIVVFV